MDEVDLGEIHETILCKRLLDKRATPCVVRYPSVEL